MTSWRLDRLLQEDVFLKEDVEEEVRVQEEEVRFQEEDDVLLSHDIGILWQRLQTEVYSIVNLSRGDANSTDGESCIPDTKRLLFQKRLIVSLLNAIRSVVNSAAVNSYDADNLAIMKIILRHADNFGADIYVQVILFMEDILYKDHSSFTALEDAGLNKEFLTSLPANATLSSHALLSFPGVLSAICKYPRGLKAVQNLDLQFFVDIFTLKKHVAVLNGTIDSFPVTVMELLMCNESMMYRWSKAIAEILKRIAEFVDLDQPSDLPSSEIDHTQEVSNELFIDLSILHVMFLLYRIGGSQKFCHSFQETSGTETLMKLLLRYCAAQSSSGIQLSVALMSNKIFTEFAQRGPFKFARFFCYALNHQLEEALDRLHSVSGSFLLKGPSIFDEVFTSLFNVEFLLYIVASSNQWANALLAEFSSGRHKDVLVVIGRLHREMLWQIALMEDARVGAEENYMTFDSEVQSYSSVGYKSFSFDVYKLLPKVVDFSRAILRQRHGSLNKDDKKCYATRRDMVRSLSSHLSHLFQELGKAMVSPPSCISPKLVLLAFVSVVKEHLAFRGHVRSKCSEASISTKCRYLGKVVDFVDVILQQGSDSCNPVVLNSLYQLGVLKCVFTTFREVTNNLLFAVNRVPTSPMEIDDDSSKLVEREKSDSSLIHDPLASYGKLMDHLVTSAYILSPSTKDLLCQPAFSGGGPFICDAETFVMVLQKMVLNAVLPVWTSAKFTDCSISFITTVLSIIKHVYQGVEVKTSGDSSARLTSHGARKTRRQVHRAGTKVEQKTKQKPSQIPTVDQVLETCTKLLQKKEPLVFPVCDLLVMLCSHNDGHFRQKIIKYINDQVERSNVDFGWESTLVQRHLHVFALIVREDATSRELAVSNGFIKLSLDFLSEWESKTCNVEGTHVPEWVTTAFLALGGLLQVDPKLLDDISEFSIKQKSTEIEGLSSKYIKVSDQKRLIEIACNCMRKHQPSDSLLAVLLKLCATLTRTHPVAEHFLEAGGVSMLLSLPVNILFEVDNVAASIIRHVLEDPQTLQQAMESMIRYSLASANNRHSSGGNRSNGFLFNLSSVVSRAPTIFIQAAEAVCQTKAGEMPCKVVTKDCKKVKSKGKKKARAPGNDRVVLGNMGSGAPGKGQGKHPASKVHREPPPSFTKTIELLFEAATSFVPLTTIENVTDMDADVFNNKGKGVITVEEHEARSQAALARTVFALKMLTEVVKMYTPSIHVVLQRDAEVNNYRGSQKASNGNGVLHHVLHEFLLCSLHSKTDENLASGWRQKLATWANQFIVACCSRSPEARRELFMELSSTVKAYIDSCDGPRQPPNEIQMLVDLVNNVLAACSLTGSYISDEASTTFINVGLVKVLIQTLQVLDLEHADSSKVVGGIVKALECVTENHLNAADVYTVKDNIPEPLLDSTSHLDAHDSSLRNLWADDNQQYGVSMSHPYIAELVIVALPCLSEPIDSSKKKAEACQLNAQRSEGAVSASKLELPIGGESFKTTDDSDTQAPLVDLKALEYLMRVLFAVQPLYEGPYQRLLLNLCTHNDTRKNLVRLLVNMLTIDIRMPPDQAGLCQPLYQLYPDQSHILYSSIQFPGGILPLLSLRILEVLTYLARNNHFVAKTVFSVMLPRASAEELSDADSRCGKVIKVTDNCENSDNNQPDGFVSIELLIRLLNQPLYLSVAHLEHLLPLLEVVIEKAEASGRNCADLQDQVDNNDMEVKESTSGSPGSLSKSNGASLNKVDVVHAFARAAVNHRRLLNEYIRENSELLEKSFSILLRAPCLIDFDNKRSYFRSKIHQQREHHPLQISVRREYILDDSYNQLQMRSIQDLKRPLKVEFLGEEGIDAGGLTREWYQLLSRAIFDKGALLFTTVGNNATFQPNPNSFSQTEHLSYFKFVGCLVAKALFDGQLLDVYFTRSFYKHILGVKVTFHDIEAVDPAYYKSLMWMLKNDVSDIPGLTFSIDADEENKILFEKTEKITSYFELKPGGRNIRVTEETKHEYAELVTDHILTKAIRPQINAFLDGFNVLVPSKLISIFHDNELELLISGLPEIDLNDLKVNTEYHGYTAASNAIQWFWEVVEAFSKEDMARLLQFVTGTSKVPLEGFKALQGISGCQRFQIHKGYGKPEQLPTAHTCFNQLVLPEYPTKEVLQARLVLAIREGSEGFELR